MTSLLNSDRSPVFCPGCSHEKVVRGVDNALNTLRLKGDQVVLVTDIGCSGLFDQFFNTHAMHGLHGRALTYATGLKMADPGLTVIVIMGDGGVGIGGAHVLSSCRRNLDITLLILNNYNYGMTGGQYSVTTPENCATSSGFLNRLEKPVDICKVAEAAGAPWVCRIIAEESNLAATIQDAIDYNGFSLLEICSLCTGRFLQRNRAFIKQRHDSQQQSKPEKIIQVNQRQEFSSAYREFSAQQPPAEDPVKVLKTKHCELKDRCEILLLGAAGQRIGSGGEILCLSAMTAGLYATHKPDYPITVLRGYSVAEVILSRTPIQYTGIRSPDVVLVLSAEGVKRRKEIFATLTPDALIIRNDDVEVPETSARIVSINFRRKFRISSANTTIGALAVLAIFHPALTFEMLFAGVQYRLQGKEDIQNEVTEIVRRVAEAGEAGL